MELTVLHLVTIHRRTLFLVIGCNVERTPIAMSLAFRRRRITGADFLRLSGGNVERTPFAMSLAFRRRRITGADFLRLSRRNVERTPFAMSLAFHRRRITTANPDIFLTAHGTPLGMVLPITGVAIRSSVSSDQAHIAG
ncbi:MAG: hypothetical protein U0L15_04330 [Oscillospiraceae bacterium]|nr:hypothetical protein [Oscillospiraceae bacterium]